MTIYDAGPLAAGPLCGFKNPLLQNPCKMIRGLLFSKMIRISLRKSEIQGKSRSYRAEIGDTDPKSEPKRPESAPERGFGLCTEKGLKAFLNPDNLCAFFLTLQLGGLRGRKTEIGAKN